MFGFGQLDWTDITVIPKILILIEAVRFILYLRKMSQWAMDFFEMRD